MLFLLFFPLFLHQFFSFFACSGMGVGLQYFAFLSHTIMDVIPLGSSASWQFLCEWWLLDISSHFSLQIVFLCDRWLWWGSVVLILHIRIIQYWCYLPCSLCQTCLVCDTGHGCQVRVYSGRGSGQVWTKTDEGQGQGAGQGVSPAGVGDRLDSMTKDNQRWSLA